LYGYWPGESAVARPSALQTPHAAPGQEDWRQRIGASVRTRNGTGLVGVAKTDRAPAGSTSAIQGSIRNPVIKMASRIASATRRRLASATEELLRWRA